MSKRKSNSQEIYYVEQNNSSGIQIDYYDSIQDLEISVFPKSFQ